MIRQGWENWKKWVVFVMIIGILADQTSAISAWGAELPEEALAAENELIETLTQSSVSPGDALASVSSADSIEQEYVKAEDEFIMETDAMIEQTYGSAMPYASTENIPVKYCNILADTNRLYVGNRTSFITGLSDGGYQTIIFYEGKLYVTNFNKSFQTTASKEITVELPSLEGVFIGTVYNYVVCMDFNVSLSDEDTAFCIIKYDKAFNKLGCLSLSRSEAKAYGLYSMGDTSINEGNGILTIYKSIVNGAGIPSYVVLCLNTDNMSINEDKTEKPPLSYVTDEYIKNKLESEIEEEILEVYTFGQETSETHYFVVGTYWSRNIPNVFLLSIDKSTGAVSQQQLTDFSPFVPNPVIGEPRIVRIAENKYAVLWGRLELDKSCIEYVVIDGGGKVCGSLKRKTGLDVTDCLPIFDGVKIIWLSVSNGKISFDTLEDIGTTGVFELNNEVVKAVNPWDGTADTSWYKESADTFQIATAQQLAGLAELVKSGNTFEGKTVCLTNDIFLNDESYEFEWMPISIWQGTFHGNGHVVYNMKTSSNVRGGLFDTIGEKGIVKAVDVSQGFLKSGGCIADENKGIIAFCNNYSCVEQMQDYAGGICISNYNLVYGCRNCGKVTGTTSGGIVGCNQKAPALVSQCSNWGLVGSSWAGAGIAGDNFGWVYNCYNRGVIANGINYSGDVDFARSMSGITYYNKTNLCPENCYSAGAYIVYAKGSWSGLYAVSAQSPKGECKNCYSTPNVEYALQATLLSTDEMKNTGFLDRLDQQSNTVFTAWMADTDNINNGLPITVADYCSYCGNYKIQPELWMRTDKSISLDIQDGEYKLNYNCYYNEKPPIITVGDSSVAQIEDQGGTIVIKPLKRGNTYLNIHFDETENVLSMDHRINIEVTSSTLDGMTVSPPTFTVRGIIGGRNVTLSSPTEGTTIYYSMTSSGLTVNDKAVVNGNTVTFTNFYGTVYARAYKDGVWSNVSRLILKIPVVNKPTITSKDGVVTIKTTTPDSYIYYTTDGSTPSPTNGTRLAKSGGSFTVPANCTVKAIAVRSCFTNSEIASASVTAKKLGAPSFVVKGVIGGREVTFNTTETKGEIYYSFTTSNITTKDLHVKPGEKVLFQNYYGTVYARTYVNGQWSNVSRLILKIPVVNKPTITAAGNGKVKISTSTPDCAIYYTTDSSTPSPTNGTRINASSSIVTVGSGKTVKAIAVRSCFTSSDVATYR